MATFKVGDKVRCIDGWYDQLIEGNIYEVTKASDREWTYVRDEGGMADGGYRSDQFVLVEDKAPAVEAMHTQVGGSHYTKLKIQPFEYANANNLGPNEFTALGYITRWKDKGGVEDLRKAIHAIQWLIEYTEKQDGSKGSPLHT